MNIPLVVLSSFFSSFLVFAVFSLLVLLLILWIRDKSKVAKFTYIKLLGQGRSGEVILAEKKETKEIFAIKILLKDPIRKSPDRKTLAKCEKEILSLPIRHPFLISLHSSFHTSNRLFFVMEYISGGTLRRHMRQFNESETRFYSAELTCALQFLHKNGFVHRDLRPENILLDSEGHCRLVDFGMSSKIENVSKSTDTIYGTPQYSAPEMINKLVYGVSVDWWSLGVIMCEMLTGVLPIRGDNDDEVHRAILDGRLPYGAWILSQETRDILRALLTVDPANRLGCERRSGGGEEIRRHPFFEETDWNAVESRQTTPPFTPSDNYIINKPEVHQGSQKKEFLFTVTPLDIIRAMRDDFRDFNFNNPHFLP